MIKKNILTEKKSRVVLTASVLFFAGFGQVYGQETKKDSLKDKSIDEVVIVGSRSGGRSKADSPVPVDVFNLKETSLVLPQTNINQILNAVAPSFTSTVQTNADGTDHLDPAQLRGLGPDQVLVLVNGKRRHTSALINVNGSPGRGTVGTDLNAIPSFALSRIEVLRDGASAQYGSDAIAGVMNLQLKRDTGKLTGQVSYGGYLTDAAKNHTGNWDGDQIQVDLNYGAKVGKKGGFVNVTFSSQYRNPTFRAGVESGNIYNAYNAIEKRAAEGGVNLSSYFSNINQIKGTPNEQQFVGLVHQYAQKVNYFDNAYQQQIQNANSITALQALLGGNYTDQELAYRGQERRDFNMWVGQSKLNNNQIFVNAEIPLSDTWKVYTFGGYGYRYGTSGGFYRRPNQSRTFTGLYLDGYLPKINTDIHDVSLSAGVKGTWDGWNVDFSNTFGQNAFNYTINNTGNTSLRFNSPSTFKAGGLRFLQNTINLDFSKKFDVFNGLNFAFGGEQRHENFQITPGAPASYLTYDVNGNPVTDFKTQLRPTDFFGNALPGGSQVFAGFRDVNAVKKSRNSYAAYADAEVNFTNWLLVDGAVRYENYSDFGNTVNFKLASRIKLMKDLNFRFAGSTGFRAPSIHQIYYNTTSTLFTNGQLLEVGTFSNDSQIAGLLQIPKLKQETSQSVSAGFTYKIPALNLNITADGYWIKVKNRIVLTGQFARPTGDYNLMTPSQQKLWDAFNEAGVNAAQFFANAIDTETRGVDVVISHNYKTSGFSLKNDFAINLNKTKRVGNIHSSDLLRDAGLEGTYFSENSRIYLEEAVPRVKASLAHTLQFGKLDVYVRNTYYGKVTGADVIVQPNTHQIMSDRVITDLSVAYGFSKNISLTLGANNVFDVYPSRNLPVSSNNDQFVYTRSTSQFGMNGRYLFTRLNFNF
ncbi:TPA: TonB-dependent receptor plug domain-containing protein [Elizabethkingia anophelis]|uniref:TonB-dependent receptor plug domain-containing protein n=1 Tax=Elizabethkingia TaxID=308865 RepID=UPI001906770A|nr:TonB-dependent receptor [Elizabethkingia sp. M8]MCT3673930.1 TonB-dependent receptor [Elizabethkingia anophelis]MCT3681414.1 TonB-dependent receptor [Elizabethkingia anophelis]MCT3701967.1 TonB-dependent receptor [Elizabethkingia anophelis]MCT3770918.1 TonB-dependent receptor [Elizabethkingia anophelis]MCT3781206.1 TonB-dependent receptor [Elizabethkingia anophelis]